LTKHTFQKIEFYITNVCNLSCEGCNRFNNFRFRGTQKWSDYSPVYEQWSTLIDIDQKIILGGEPLMNPTLLDWIAGIQTFWPKNPLQVLTNGYYLDKITGLYDTCRQYNAWVGISRHRDDNLELLESKIEAFLGRIVTKKVTERENDGKEYSYFNGKVHAFMWDQYHFYESSLINEGTHYKLHNSDPEIAHAHCPHANHKNLHFSKGMLYKCASVDLIPELDRQVGLLMTDQDRKMYSGYKPLTVDNFESYHNKFIASLDAPIPHCKFCPQQYNYKKISAEQK
jgi:organic radical activating enzyme